MSWCDFLKSSIGKKYLVAVTGLGISGFSLTHMAGNMLILVGADAYNRYAHALVSNPAIELAEFVLAGLFFIHFALALSLARQNSQKRESKYGGAPHEKVGSFASRTMALSGLVLLVFLISHLISFKYGPDYRTQLGGIEMRDLHRLVVEKFKEPLFVGWYLFSLSVLGLHLSHGMAAAFQSLGVASSLNPKLKGLGVGFALLVAGGFIIQPLFVFLGIKG